MPRQWVPDEITYLLDNYVHERTDAISEKLSRTIPAVHQKAKKLGLDKSMGRRATPPHDRFWDKVKKKRGCWEWTGSKDSHGYGTISIGPKSDNRRVKAHRISYEIHNGQISDGMCICHKCDNPECTNPRHLFSATHGENMTDMVVKRRHAHGSKNGHAKLSEKDVSFIRRSSHLRGRDLAARYGVSEGTISQIKNYPDRHWKHVK